MSHAHDDWAFVNVLVAVLNRHQVPLWYAQRQLLGGQQWMDEIGQALGRCDWFAVVVSASSTSSMWVRREVTHALGQRRLDNRIIPIRLDPVDSTSLAWPLGGFQHVDFTGNFHDGCRALLSVWGMSYVPNP